MNFVQLTLSVMISKKERAIKIDQPYEYHLEQICRFYQNFLLVKDLGNNLLIRKKNPSPPTIPKRAPYDYVINATPLRSPLPATCPQRDYS